MSLIHQGAAVRHRIKERDLVMLPEAPDPARGANARRPVPAATRMPVAGQFHRRLALAGTPEAREHITNNPKRVGAIASDGQTVLGRGSGHKPFPPKRGRKWPHTRLHHQFGDIPDSLHLNHAVAFNPKELMKADCGQSVGRWNAEERGRKLAHVVTAVANPHLTGRVMACHLNPCAPLGVGHGIVQGRKRLVHPGVRPGACNPRRAKLDQGVRRKHLAQRGPRLRQGAIRQHAKRLDNGFGIHFRPPVKRQ